ncbi:protein fem-1 homolog B-like [Orbicella faveolata]|uniref:protein fem-1 homolog B-like n=1 Tax=Orbicella faveolata TaxID=48498 RepID=UPI0009E34755|nr:protein fem-1 homolog B-like [Orbicella faveolata]
MSEKRSDSEHTNPVAILYEAARDGAVVVLSDVLQRMSISERSTALETKTKDGDQITTPLIIAARNGNLDSVKMLLEYNADIEARGTVKVNGQVIEGCTPLWAAANGHLDVVKLLIERNADVDGRNLLNSTPLRAAAYDGRLDIVSCLVENGADVDAPNKFHRTPLMMACYYGHMNVVIYLIERGANMDLQDIQGYTALHCAVEGDQFETANKLLALGASQLPDVQRLTPLLWASNKCKIDMVEYLIKRPEFTKEQRIEGLELLGATIANTRGVYETVYDIEKAFYYMKRSMKERFQDKSCPLLKKQTEPLEVYQNRKESQTLEELVLLEGDDHAIHMEGLIIRERILGTDNTELRFPIEYRGAVFADSENYELCIGLWEHAMEIGQRCNVAVTSKLLDMAGLFSVMLHKQTLLRSECVERVFEKLVVECERQKEKLISITMTLEEHEPTLFSPQFEINRLLHCALYLLMIYTKVQVPERKETKGIFDLIKRLLCLNPRTRDGNTLLHLAAWHKTEITVPRNVRLVCKLPCVETMKLIMHAGYNVNAINTKGNSPLHLAVTFKPSTKDLQLLRDVLETLVDGGIHEDTVNSEGKTAMDIAETDEARRILSVKLTLRLKCIAARAVRKFGLCYVGIVPKTLERFISLH